MFYEMKLNIVVFFMMSLLYLKNCNNFYLHKENYKFSKKFLSGKDILIINFISF